MHLADPVGRFLAEVDKAQQTGSDMLQDCQDPLVEVEVAVASPVVSARHVLAVVGAAAGQSCCYNPSTGMK